MTGQHKKKYKIVDILFHGKEYKYSDSKMTSDKIRKNETPLSERMRPQTLDFFYGQAHLMEKGKTFRSLIDKGEIGSMIFWGPPGSGKTTLARIIAEKTKRRFVILSAVNSGISDLRKVIDSALSLLNSSGEKTILFIDEIHRFNKVQQDALLPYLEDGTLTMISATTENPSFEVISALRSRCRIFRLKELSVKDIRNVIDRAISDTVSGFGEVKISMEPDAMDYLTYQANGDARFALNTIEAGVASVVPDQMGVKNITLKIIEDVIQERAPLYDKRGSEHFDHASAFQKSIRGSDPDAAIYWLAKMIIAGEEPKFIARRLIVTASEDVGSADPLALLLAMSAASAVELIGWPEARIPLAQAVSYIASAPKSNSTVLAIDRALKDIKEGKSYPVPDHLKSNPPSPFTKGGRGIYGSAEYKYPHDYKDHFVEQAYLPEELKGVVYYEPSSEGREKLISERLKKIGKIKTFL